MKFLFQFFVWLASLIARPFRNRAARRRARWLAREKVRADLLATATARLKEEARQNTIDSALREYEAREEGRQGTFQQASMTGDVRMVDLSAGTEKKVDLASLNYHEEVRSASRYSENLPQTQPKPANNSYQASMNLAMQAQGYGVVDVSPKGPPATKQKSSARARRTKGVPA